MVICRIEERNPLIKLRSDAVDLLKIIRHAVEAFWIKHLELHPNFLSEESNRLSRDNLLENMNQEAPTQDPTINGYSPLKETFNSTPIGTTPSQLATPVAGTPLKRPNQRASVPDINVPFSALRAAPEHGNIPLNQDKSFEKNERLARVLFFDLPSEGKDGSLSFLAASCVKLVFDVEWTNDTAESYL